MPTRYAGVEADPRMKNRPDFLLIGAQKCATTWLHRQVAQHPDVFMAPAKDTAWFFWERTRGQSEYWEQFRQAKAAAIGETSAAYFWTRTGSPWDNHPDGCERDIAARIVHELGHDCRYIVTLRDPVDRALSAYLHHLRTGDLATDDPIEECLGEHGIVDIGLYAQHLENWLKHVSHDQILLINLYDICHDPRSVMRSVFRFLEIEDNCDSQGLEQPAFPGADRRWMSNRLLVKLPGLESELEVANEQTVHALRSIFRPDATRLANYAGEAFVKRWQTVAAA